MDRNEINSKLTKIFREVFQNSSLILSEEQPLENIPLYDDMRFNAMIRKVESSFNVKFELQDLRKISCLGDIIDYIIKESRR